jgi:isoprenylcysteine carboxyl methyltransferase (ICMT) family protein YpbQ
LIFAFRVNNISGKPQSATAQWICFTGFGVATATFFALKSLGISPLHVSVGCLVSLALTIVFLDSFILKVYKRPDSGLDFTKAFKFNAARVLIKLMGLAITLELIALAYWVLPEYQGNFYHHLWAMLRFYWPYLLTIAVVYFVFVDAKMRDPKDGYWQAGCLLLGRWKECDKATLKQFALGWLVKAFFFPLMFTYLVNDFTRLLSFNPASLTSPMAVYDFLFLLTFAIDVLFAALGYLMTLRLFGAHIRSTDPTLLGWSVAIVCYQPAWSFFSSHYLIYQDGYAWGAWLSGAPVMLIVWVVLIASLNLVYLWSTITFGIRFSNLTHRGILTNGPYQFTKHPAYIAKNLSWWLIAVPFLPIQGWDIAFKQCLMLLGLNLIYYARAKTEERHLSMDGTYVSYANWMNDHGMFKSLNKLIPFFRYQAKTS